MSRTPVALAFALAALTTSSVSCTAILAPRDDVQRCGTADDCDDTMDARYVPVCQFDDANADLDSTQVDKICVADFRPSVSCNPETYQNTADPQSPHPFKEVFDEAADAARYLECDPMTQAGMLGCLPAGNACNDGLTVNNVGLCDDDDPSTPKAVPITSVDLPNGVDSPFGHEVRDQFCRSYFCDDRFVCDLDSNFCVLCDEDDAYGRGGCGQVYIAGARSSVYEDGGACQGATVTPETVTYGPVM